MEPGDRRRRTEQAHGPMARDVEACTGITRCELSRRCRRTRTLLFRLADQIAVNADNVDHEQHGVLPADAFAILLQKPPGDQGHRRGHEQHERPAPSITLPRDTDHDAEQSVLSLAPDEMLIDDSVVNEAKAGNDLD